MGQDGIYTKHGRHVRAGNTRVSETSFRRKHWKVELSSQSIATQNQSHHYFQSCLMNDTYIQIMFPVYEKLWGFFVPPASVMQSCGILAFQQGCSLCDLLPAPPWDMCWHLWGYGGHSLWGRPPGSPAALAGISDSTRLYLGLSIDSTPMM